ncbi:hypothetical protein [Streptomyces albiaxialis]|uniref:hypothetical protein n=1 Tax=Streptomyces albiaxialis TaxID=329523 RepID=UPI0031E0EE2D
MWAAWTHDECPHAAGRESREGVLAHAVIAGGGFAGPATALALGSAGYWAVVLERSPPPPEGPLAPAAERWYRPTVPQAAHSHNLTGLGVKVLRAHAPQVLDEVLRAGAGFVDLTENMPVGIGDRARRKGDEELVALGCRRTSLELALYRAARAAPGVEIRHGTTVRGLRIERRPARPVRAMGVVVQGGRSVPADAVIDATGRRRAAARTWLTDLGIPVRDDLEHRSDLAVCTRFYRRPGPRPPPGRAQQGHRRGRGPGPLRRLHASRGRRHALRRADRAAGRPGAARTAPPRTVHRRRPRHALAHALGRRGRAGPRPGARRRGGRGRPTRSP